MNPRALRYFERGETAFTACQADQRFGYFLYVPAAFRFEDAERFNLVVVIHGTARTPHRYRELFRGFADRHNSIVLLPMFPVGIVEPGNSDAYNFIAFKGLRYDHVLLEMVAEVAERYRIDVRRFLMHGYSGGGQFAHRFFYLHPERLRGISIGAPGMVTLLDETRDWHCGIRGFESAFGRGIDIAALRRVPVQLVIGAEDTETWEITIEPTSPVWMEGVNDAGRTRVDRLRALRDSFRAKGIETLYEEVPGVGHMGYDVLEPVKAFFSDIIQDPVPASKRPADETQA